LTAAPNALKLSHAPEDILADHPVQENPYTAADIIAILRKTAWLILRSHREQIAWSGRAAQLLGHYAEDRAALANLLRPVFHYDAAEILQSPDAKPPFAQRARATSSAI